MKTYSLFGEKITFDDAADRFYFLLNDLSTTQKVTSDLYERTYDQAGNISTVLNEYPQTVFLLTKACVARLYEKLTDAEIYDVGEDEFKDICWDLTSAQKYYDAIAEKVADIDGDLAEIKEYRAERKASRSKYGWISSSDMSSVISASMRAGTLNAISGLGHSVVNGIGNLSSSMSASSSKRALYNSSKTFEILNEGILECITSIYSSYMEFMNSYKEKEGKGAWFNTSKYSVDKATALLNNSKKVGDKKKELLLRAVCTCPYHEELLETIFLEYEDERKNIYEIAKHFDVDLSGYVDEMIENLYTDEATDNQENAEAAKEKIKALMKEYRVNGKKTICAIDHDFLEKRFLPYEKALPGQRQEILDFIRSYDADDKVKSELIKEHYIWELVDEYSVKITDKDVTSIVKSILRRENIGFDEKKDSVRIILQTLHVDRNNEFDNFIYDYFVSCFKPYKSALPGTRQEFLDLIVSFDTSDDVKSYFIKENKIWELAGRYNVEFSPEEKEKIIEDFIKNSDLPYSEKKENILYIVNTLGLNSSASMDKYMYESLKAIATPYKKTEPDKRQEILDQIVAFDAPDSLKNILVSENKIWELADKYNVSFTKDEKEKIIKNFIDCYDLSYSEKVERARIMIRTLGVDSSRSLDDFMYGSLETIAESYKKTEPDKRQEILDQIVAFDAPDSLKSMLVYREKIWELADKYEVSFSRSEKESFVEEAIASSTLPYELTREKACEVIDKIKLKDCDTLYRFDWNHLCELFENDSGETLVGRSKEVTDSFISNNIPEKVKKDFVQKHEIWQLAKKYDVRFPEEIMDSIILGRYNQIVSESNGNDALIVEELRSILRALDIMDEAGTITKENGNKYFNLLSGICKEDEEYTRLSGEFLSYADRINKRIIEIRKKFEFDIYRMKIGPDWIATGAQKKAKELEYCKIKDDELPLIIYSNESSDPMSFCSFCVTDKRLIATQRKARSEAPLDSIVSFDKKGLLQAIILVKFSNSATWELDISKYPITEMKKFVDYVRAVVFDIRDNARMIANVTTEDKKSLSKGHLERAISILETNRTLVSFFNKHDVLDELKNQLESLNKEGAELKVTTEQILEPRKPESQGSAPETNETENTPTESYENRTENAEEPVPGPVPAANTVSEPVQSDSLSLLQQICLLSNKYGSSAIGPTYFAGGATYAKKINKAIVAFAPIKSNETPLFLEDSTVFGSAKEGCVWTTETVYNKNFLENQIAYPIDQISGITFTKYDKSSYYIMLIIGDKPHRFSTRYDESSANLAVKFYSDVLMLIKRNKENH